MQVSGIRGSNPPPAPIITRKTMKQKKNKTNQVTQAEITEIQQKLRENVKADFLAVLNPDGTAPRGIIASLARKYGYTQAGITRMLASQGIKKQTRYTNVNPL